MSEYFPNRDRVLSDTNARAAQGDARRRTYLDLAAEVLGCFCAVGFIGLLCWGAWMLVARVAAP